MVWRITRVRLHGRASMMAIVSGSVEPSSTTMTSKDVMVWLKTLRIESSRYRPSLKHGTTMLTSGWSRSGKSPCATLASSAARLTSSRIWSASACAATSRSRNSSRQSATNPSFSRSRDGIAPTTLVACDSDNAIRAAYPVRRIRPRSSTSGSGSSNATGWSRSRRWTAAVASPAWLLGCRTAGSVSYGSSGLP